MSIPQGMGGRGSGAFTGYINSITWLVEAQGNDEGDRDEQSPGKWDGGGGRGGIVIFQVTLTA